MQLTHPQVHDVVRDVLETVERAGSDGIPVRDTFVATMAHFQSIGQFQSLANCLVSAGTLALNGDTFISTKPGEALLGVLRQEEVEEAETVS